MRGYLAADVAIHLGTSRVGVKKAVAKRIELKKQGVFDE